MTATEYMTAVMNERLHMSGERDQIKNILLEDLRTHGWTETMFKAATKATAVHNAENETVVGTGSANSFQTLTAHQLADLISKPAHGKLFHSVSNSSILLSHISFIPCHQFIVGLRQNICSCI